MMRRLEICFLCSVLFLFFTAATCLADSTSAEEPASLSTQMPTTDLFGTDAQARVAESLSKCALYYQSQIAAGEITMVELIAEMVDLEKEMKSIVLCTAEEMEADPDTCVGKQIRYGEVFESLYCIYQAAGWSGSPTDSQKLEKGYEGDRPKCPSGYKFKSDGKGGHVCCYMGVCYPYVPEPPAPIKEKEPAK